MSTDHDFNTPPWFLSLVHQLDPRGIGLDPCSNAYSMVKARTAYTISDNGLMQSWRGHGLVFVNPPHSMSPMNIEPWMEKAHQEFVMQPHNYHDATQDSLCMLVPSKTDTAWFHNHATPMAARCFLQGRPKFWHHGEETKGPGKFASMVIYHGPSVGRFMLIFDGYGWSA